MAFEQPTNKRKVCNGSREEYKRTDRECGDGGVEERGDGLAVDDLAFGVDTQVLPPDLHRGLVHAHPVHPVPLFPEQPEVVVVDVADEGVNQCPPLRHPQTPHIHWTGIVGMEREGGVEPVHGGQPLDGRPFQLSFIVPARTSMLLMQLIPSPPQRQ